MELEKLLNKYRKISLEMIELLKKEEDISSSLQEREIIIKKIDEMHIENQIICNKIEELEILKLEEELDNLIKDSMFNIKKEIKKVKQSMAAYKKYSDFNSNPMIFSTIR